jgi:hypothetical protein
MKQTTTALVYLIIAAVLAVLVIRESAAIPSGAVLTYQRNSTSNGSNPSTLNDSGGYIYVANINTVQQDTNWKAYIGNVTGSLTLDDSTGRTVYDWDLAVTTGEVYASRNASVTWPSIGCAGGDNVSAENTFFGFSTLAADNINGTFNSSLHKSFIVGTKAIAQSSCNATALYINNVRQAVSTASTWQQILLSDGPSLVFASPLEQNSAGYDNQPYDFQLILPENGTVATATTYYFWAEIS